mmetsp:Transcript_61346/g.155832  ORF Transcript_61346/g.155832 Transcript_61346/m.155832 type:complete len:201 (-) Transcript_61346:422-1024(-)
MAPEVGLGGWLEEGRALVAPERNPTFQRVPQGPAARALEAVLGVLGGLAEHLDDLATLQLAQGLAFSDLQARRHERVFDDAQILLHHLRHLEARGPASTPEAREPQLEIRRLHRCTAPLQQRLQRRRRRQQRLVQARCAGELCEECACVKTSCSGVSSQCLGDFPLRLGRQLRPRGLQRLGLLPAAALQRGHFENESLNL